jgi:hypothetical protein
VARSTRVVLIAMNLVAAAVIVGYLTGSAQRRRAAL